MPKGRRSHDHRRAPGGTTVQDRARELAERWRCDGIIPDRYNQLVGTRPEHEIAAILELLVEARLVCARRAIVATHRERCEIEVLIEKIDKVLEGR